MYGALWDFAAAHEKRADWRKQSLDWIESVYKLFKQYNSFYEYNSPSYYGVDLFALALWRKYGSTEHIQAMGGDMEATLWRTIAEFYQPDLHNLAGPYDRSYGMDMESPGHRTAGGIIELTRYAVDEKGVPIPGAAKLAGPGFSFAMAILGTRIPADALTKFSISKRNIWSAGRLRISGSRPPGSANRLFLGAKRPKRRKMSERIRNIIQLQSSGGRRPVRLAGCRSRFRP
jgi:hypothetical protein